VSTLCWCGFFFPSGERLVYEVVYRLLFTLYFPVGHWSIACPFWMRFVYPRAAAHLHDLR
jgi:hypothetical protein